MKSKRKISTVRFNPAVYAQLRKLASKNKDSINTYIQRILEHHIESIHVRKDDLTLDHPYHEERIERQMERREREQ